MTSNNPVSNERLGDLIENLVRLSVEEGRCMDRFLKTEGEEKKGYWKSAGECRDEIKKIRDKLNGMNSVQTEEIYATCQDCGQVLTREAYELHNADHSVTRIAK